MLRWLSLKDVGPAPTLEVELTPRLNVFTGDNAVGKSFLLDIAWWVLTNTWARMRAAPRKGTNTTPSISYRYDVGTKPHEATEAFRKRQQEWPARQDRTPVPALVIYAQADGGFSVWDPERNQPHGQDPDAPERPRAFLFRPDEVWDGLPLGAAKKQCNGLIADWANWQRENGEAFKQLTRVLRHLSSSEQEPLVPADLTRVSLDDVRDHPTLRMPYGDVALVHASSGMRRIVALAYLLVWTWREHLRACELTGTKPARQVIFLVDEIEAHLHPQWQRRIMPALLDVMQALSGENGVSIQLITSTHSPLALASIEPYFDTQKDSLWELELVDGQVEIKLFPWRRQGDVNAWLQSSIFDMAEPRSLEAERAIRHALELLRRRPTQMSDDIRNADQALRGVLGEMDRFWVRWSAFIEDLEGSSASRSPSP